MWRWRKKNFECSSKVWQKNTTFLRLKIYLLHCVGICNGVLFARKVYPFYRKRIRENGNPFDSKGSFFLVFNFYFTESKCKWITIFIFISTFLVCGCTEWYFVLKGTLFFKLCQKVYVHWFFVRRKISSRTAKRSQCHLSEVTKSISTAVLCVGQCRVIRYENKTWEFAFSVLFAFWRATNSPVSQSIVQKSTTPTATLNQFFSFSN